ncbi:MAG: hypothetical protein HYR74_12635 [Candidatus Eisenbacteria bacterium]|nr:hypothetical protein [Candidatus Eisenbacteria bacterium]
MKLRHALVVLILAILGVIAWRSELWMVARPGDRPRPLAAIAPGARRPVALDVILPAVPFGSRHVAAGAGVLIIHYWAPWERHSREQAARLDSLRQRPECADVGVIVACCDPFPSVTRYVARERLRLSVVIDGAGELRRALPCPSVPFTYVLDGGGRIAVAQAGEVDWLAPASVAAIAALQREARPAPRGTGT